MELTTVDFARPDHRQHAVGGAILAAGTLAALYAWDPEVSLPVRILVPIAVAGVGGILKEVYDYRHPESHTCESGDAIATGLGGAAVAATFVWIF